MKIWTFSDFKIESDGSSRGIMITDPDGKVIAKNLDKRTGPINATILKAIDEHNEAMMIQSEQSEIKTGQKKSVLTLRNAAIAGVIGVILLG